MLKNKFKIVYLLILVLFSLWFMLNQDGEIAKEELTIKRRRFEEESSVAKELKKVERPEVATSAEIEEEIKEPIVEMPSDPYEALRQSGSASSVSTDTSSYVDSVQKLEPGIVDDSSKDSEAKDPYLELRRK